jgi:hypothetical protein
VPVNIEAHLKQKTTMHTAPVSDFTRLPMPFARLMGNTHVSMIVAGIDTGIDPGAMLVRIVKAMVRVGPQWELVILYDHRQPDLPRRLAPWLGGAAVRLVHVGDVHGPTAVRSGLQLLSGDAIVVLDRALQRHPEDLPELIDLWRGGCDLVVRDRIDLIGRWREAIHSGLRSAPGDPVWPDGDPLWPEGWCVAGRELVEVCMRDHAVDAPTLAWARQCHFVIHSAPVPPHQALALERSPGTPPARPAAPRATRLSQWPVIAGLMVAAGLPMAAAASPVVTADVELPDLPDAPAGDDSNSADPGPAQTR